MASYTITRGESTRLEILRTKYLLASEPRTGASATVFGELPAGITAVAVLDGLYAIAYLVGTTNDHRDKWSAVVQMVVNFAESGGRSQAITGGSGGGLRDAGSFPERSALYAVTVDINLTGEPDPNAVNPMPPGSSSPGDGSAPLQLLTFREARQRARKGARIIMPGWQDRWLSYDGNWKLTLVNPLTGKILEERVPHHSDQSAAWYASKWQVL